MSTLKLKPLSIGNVHLATNLLLAPIAGYCDVAFRLVARSCGGVGMACTDLLCPEACCGKTSARWNWPPPARRIRRCACSFTAADIDLLCEAARWAEDRGAHVIDINMGCPVDKVTKRDGGSKLLCDPGPHAADGRTRSCERRCDIRR